VIISVELPGTLQGDYHLAAGSPAIDMGATSKSSVNSPVFDIDNQLRPAGALCQPDSGADEIQTGGTCVDLSITKTNGATSVVAGSAVNYTIVVGNSGPSAVTGATVTDNFPTALTVGSWTCTASAGSSCAVGGSDNNRTGTVTLLAGGSATFTANTTLSGSASGTLDNTATVAAPSGAIDTNPANNSATDTDTIVPPANKHIGDLEGLASNPSVPIWTALVVIQVHNNLHQPVGGALVTGVWSAGGIGLSACITDGNGQCTIVRALIPDSQATKTFTITNITGANGAGPYVAANNHDPDGDSTGTVIVIARP
jgi:uncharacterized repeat protein (TIGR01451 family)